MPSGAAHSRRPRFEANSEGQVLAVAGRFHRRWRRHGAGSCSCCGSGCSQWLRLPAADRGEPAALIFTALYIETQTYLVADIEGELIGAVAEEIESYLAGIILVGFKDVFLYFPGVTGLGCA